jgi:hypothetical protein
LLLKKLRLGVALRDLAKFTEAGLGLEHISVWPWNLPHVPPTG